jgi:hypothetical protein
MQQVRREIVASVGEERVYDKLPLWREYLALDE